MKKVLCEFCLDLVDYTVKEEKGSINIRNKEYYYTKKITFCNECHNEINVNDVLDENIDNINKSYRKEENI